MPKSQPMNVRLRSELHDRVCALAKRSNRSKNAVIEELIDEAERMRRHHHVKFVGEYHRRAALAGTRWDVWRVIDMLGHMSAETVSREFNLPLSLIEAAQSYYREFAAEIDTEIARYHRPIEEAAREDPSTPTYA